MSIRALVSTFAFVALVTVAGTASAQTWSPEQQEIWKFEEQQWQMARDKDLSWIDKMVHPNVSLWDSTRPHSGEVYLFARLSAAFSNRPRILVT